MLSSDPALPTSNRWRPMGRERARKARADELPLRAELFSVSQLERHAESMAGWHAVAPTLGRASHYLLDRLDDNAATFRSAYALLTDAVERGRQITPAAEWFIDNHALIEDQVRTARRHLPRAYSRELPRLANAVVPGTPRVYDLALELISHSHGRVDRVGLRAFIGAYQAIQPLLLGELWAVPIMLRLALLENLRRVIVSVSAERRERERAAYWIDEMNGAVATDPGKLVLVLARLVEEDPPLTDAFVAELATRLQVQGPALQLAMAWLEERLAEQGQTVEHVFHLASRGQAADQVAVSNSIGTLRFSSATDWRVFVESMSVVEQTLRTDPSGTYPEMDFATRDRYRHVVEAIARRSSASEDGVARAAIRLAEAECGHVGLFLVTDRRRDLERATAMRGSPRIFARRVLRRFRMAVYTSALVGLTALVAGALALAAPAAPSGWFLVPWWVLLVLSASLVAVAIVHTGATLLIRPQLLPRLDFSKGIPPEHQTVVAIPAMLTDIGAIDELVEALEVRFLANRNAHLSFALLSDFRDAPSETLESDAALLDHAREAVLALNMKYGGGGRVDPEAAAPERGDAVVPFFLLHRARAWNASEGVWMGWERKRGKLEDFNATLRGEPDRFATLVGPVAQLQGVRYVIALDADTDLPRDAAHLLAATLAHPLNRPVYDAAVGRVTSGYAILQPRVGVSMASTASTRFARLFAGDPGIDPYTRAVSDVFQDAFDEGSFVGKGIYDVDALRSAVSGRFPENRVLSHDLLEGAYARAGLVSDVVLVEDFPSSHAADVSRRARWIRGDWQIASWLLWRVPGPTGRVRNPLSRLSRWKILDNLRRSVAPIALVTLLLGGWLTAGVAAFATLVVTGVLMVPGLLAAANALARRPGDQRHASYLREIGGTYLRQLGREMFSLATLPYDALLSFGAIATTLTRLAITRRHLLAWRTAADAQRDARVGLLGSYVSIAIAPALAAAAATALALLEPAALPWASPVLALWLLAPAASWWLSRPLVRAAARLTSDEVAFLRGVARRTWRFFETFVVAEDNHLPPDNFQETAGVGVAHRVSPTNLGLALTANLAAFDFGYLTSGGLVARTARAFATMDRMQRYRGHFYNWYDSRTLEPLQPMYVSTVDSGNLAGHLLTLAGGLEELGGLPILGPQTFTGLADTLDQAAGLTKTWPEVQRLVARLRDELASEADAPSLSGRRRLLERLAAGARELVEAVGRRVAARPEGALGTRDNARYGVATPVRAYTASAPSSLLEALWWVQAVAIGCQQALTELILLAPWLERLRPGEDAPAHLDAVLTLQETARLDLTAAPDEPDGALSQAVALAADRAVERLSAIRALAARCRELADIDFDLLYNRNTHLLAIGYSVTDQRVDDSAYDLLASEARLASFIAVAQGKLPQEHWFSLGRQLTSAGGRPALISWSGSMFEYLMPQLIMPTYPRTLLAETCDAVVARQIAYGRELDLPWGISECGYNQVDAAQNYQYRAFGVPGLGFKRGLADERVIAPYASSLALMVAPQAACANLRRLASAGEFGPYGFYEAIDYTPARLPPGQDHVTVRSYMAHHHGMTFLALVKLLRDRPMQRRFEADPAFRATDLLLQERVPRATMIYPHPPEFSAAASVPDETGHLLRVYTTPATPAPEVHLLSNGQYHVAITNAGGGYSRWRDLAVTRWREDPTRDCWGSFGYLRDVATGAFWSVAHQPTLRAATSYEAIFAQGRAEFRRLDDEIYTHVEISVSPEDDVELRRVSLTNRGRTQRVIEITSYGEVVLAPAAADIAHMAFSNLFVETELIREHQAIVVTRRPRSSDERPPWLIHHMIVHGTVTGEASYETARPAFIGRGRSPSDPVALYQAALTDSAGAVLDPIVAIRRRVVLEPQETARVHIVTGVAETRDGALALLEKYRDRHAAKRVFELSWTHSQVVQRRLGATDLDIQLYERLASHVLYANPALRAPASVIARNRAGQPALWAYGISGDLPIVLVRVSDFARLDLVTQLVKAHAYWRVKGLGADLVVWIEDPSGYRQQLMDEIVAIVGAVSDSACLDKPGGIFVRRSEQIAEEDKILMQTLARVLVTDTAGTLAEQLDRRPRAELPEWGLAVQAPARVERQTPPGVTARSKRPDLVAFNGLGGFTPDGREYVITTGSDRRTAAPWVNVLANPWFGSVVSESGSAYTWCENAHSYRLTPWSNDAVGDPSGEAFFVRDEEDGRFWSPTPQPAGAAASYVTRHGFGYSVFEVTERGIATTLTTYVATDAPVKFVVLTVRNRSGRSRRVSLTGFFELVLGEHRAGTGLHVVTELDLKTAGLTARNAYDGDFGARVAFLDCSEEKRSVSGDRVEILGRNGSTAQPACMRRAKLSGASVPGSTRASRCRSPSTSSTVRSARSPSPSGPGATWPTRARWCGVSGAPGRRAPPSRASGSSGSGCSAR